MKTGLNQKSLRLKVIVAFVCIVFFSCKKDSTSQDNITGNSGIQGSSVNPSGNLLIEMRDTYSHDDSHVFEYDNQNRLFKFYGLTENGADFPWYVYYKNGRINYVVSEGKDSNHETIKSSMIFIYGSNGKCVKLLNKKTVKGYANDDAYFSDITSDLYDSSDSLVYDVNNRISETYQLLTYNSVPTPWSNVKFFYPDQNTKIPNKLEEWYYDQNGAPFLRYRMTITTTSRDNPLYSILWYCPFVEQTDEPNMGRNVMRLPILFDDPSVYLNKFMTMVPKCISSYSVHFAYQSTDTRNAEYIYNLPDSLHMKLTCREYQNLGSLEYIFKVKK